MAVVETEQVAWLVFSSVNTAVTDLSLRVTDQPCCTNWPGTQAVTTGGLLGDDGEVLGVDGEVLGAEGEVLGVDGEPDGLSDGAGVPVGRVGTAELGGGATVGPPCDMVGSGEGTGADVTGGTGADVGAVPVSGPEVDGETSLGLDGTVLEDEGDAWDGALVGLFVGGAETDALMPGVGGSDMSRSLLTAMAKAVTAAATTTVAAAMVRFRTLATCAWAPWMAPAASPAVNALGCGGVSRRFWRSLKSMAQSSTARRRGDAACGTRCVAAPRSPSWGRAAVVPTSGSSSTRILARARCAVTRTHDS